MNISEILKSQDLDNLPPEVCHDAQLANRASDESEGCGEALSLDEADAGGDQEDAGDVIGQCVICCKPIVRGFGCECIPF